MRNWQYFSERNDQFKIRTFGPLSGTYEIRQSKINSRWVAGPIGQTNRRPSV